MTASQLGWVVSELIKRESAPGGPYILYEDPVKNESINQDIAAFIARHTQSSNVAPPINDIYGKKLFERYNNALSYINKLPKPLSQPLVTHLERIKSADTCGEIGLLSTFFHDSYAQQPPSLAMLNLLEKLDTANILIWVSYSIYDQAVDDQSLKAIQLIPAASALLRTVLSLFEHGRHRKVIDTLIDTVDAAMAEEIGRNTKNHTSLTTLFDAMGRKSIAHIAGPLILATHLELNHTANIKAALQHYCSARQLLDDLYDWKDDLLKGHFTYANIRLAKVTIPNSQRTIKRQIMKEVLNMSTSATRVLHTLPSSPQITTPQNNMFTTVTSARITQIASRALAYDTATTEAIASYAANIDTV